MKSRQRRAWMSRLVVPMIAATAVVSGQQTRQTPVFRATTDYVSTDVIVRDKTGKFVPDLRLDEFQVFEDGVPQKVTNFVLTVGGRVLTELGPTTSAPAVSEGLILPPSRPPADTSGRIFIIFIDDLHLQALDTPRVRQVLQQIRDTVLHEGDLVGLVSTGYSSIAVDLNYDYDRVRFNESINKVMGSGMTPDEIIKAGQTAEGPSGLRHNAYVAFSTAYDLLAQAVKFNNRRKAFIYVSSGYDFNPFTDSRFKAEQERYSMPRDNSGSGDGSGTEASSSGNANYQNPFETNGLQFSEADLISQLAELTRTARRANVTFYTIDPRGLNSGMADINQTISSQEWQKFLNNSISSLMVLGEQTGGFCACNTNDFKRYLQRIDNEMSDYYVIGYTSSNPDPLKIRRRIEIKVTRPDLEKPIYKDEYTLPRSSRPKAPASGR